MTGELSFVEEAVYPTIEQFKMLVLSGKFPLLTGINYKHSENWGDLSALQLRFGADQISPLFETNQADPDQL